MGFSCKQTHLILYLEIGSGWPQNKDQPQRIDISQEAKKKQKKKKNPAKPDQQNPKLQEFGLSFPFPPALLFPTCILHHLHYLRHFSLSLSCCQFYHHRHQNPATTKVGALCDLRLPKLKCNTTTTVSFSVCRSCQFLLFLFLKFCFWDFLQPVSQRLCFALCSTTFLERLDLCRQDVNQVSSIASRASSVGGDSSSSSEANSSRFSQSSYPYGKGN